ncbi:MULTISPECIES: CBS domain-containing protein [Actinomadura]|uniref:CBS domain-containing protein n=1 Tax=Actinomadura litoris TaxID=2678616 RepID=A0A7K1LE00_9ACTN|nr:MULTISPECIES: CBS domain-containing protein [Actinomadura]MBT2212782.1 CBS domain-containing protein [Actinomadura sp. NEAU-AAG7]MUN42660.1 CBS domain-containing protein [Actinomadura litoris]
MLVREAMTSPVVTIPPSATVRQAIRVLDEHEITALPVVDGGRLVGIVSEMDLLLGEFEADPRAFARPRTAPSGSAGPGTPSPRHVGDVMTREVETARPGTDVAELAELMMRTRIRCVPVLDGPAIVGVLSRRDLVSVLARGDARIRDDVLAAIAELGPGAPFDVSVDGGAVELRGAAGEPARRIAEVLARTVPGVRQVSIRPVRP